MSWTECCLRWLYMWHRHKHAKPISAPLTFTQGKLTRNNNYQCFCHSKRKISLWFYLSNHVTQHEVPISRTQIVVDKIDALSSRLLNFFFLYSAIEWLCTKHIASPNQTSRRVISFNFFSLSVTFNSCEKSCLIFGTFEIPFKRLVFRCWRRWLSTP